MNRETLQKVRRNKKPLAVKRPVEAWCGAVGHCSGPAVAGWRLGSSTWVPGLECPEPLDHGVCGAAGESCACTLVPGMRSRCLELWNCGSSWWPAGLGSGAGAGASPTPPSGPRAVSSRVKWGVKLTCPSTEGKWMERAGDRKGAKEDSQRRSTVLDKQKVRSRPVSGTSGPESSA